GGTGQLCITCHRNDDIHHNGLGPRCGECHTQQSWAAAHFEHTRVGCELSGAHRFVPCVGCHIGGNFTALATNCLACHNKDRIRATAISVPMTVHTGFTTCTICHNTNFWGPIGTTTKAAGGRESVCR
ncbi:MAG TPA: hypothetical protein VIA18_25050, partial [Polyangia bacterium]|nr:hypothetical protein [Polyangia bacterium]